MVSRRSSANNSAKKATWCSQQLTTSPYLARGREKGVAVTSFIRLTKVKVYNKLYHLLRAVTLVEFLAPTTNRQEDRQLTQINRSFQDIRQHQHLIGGIRIEARVAATTFEEAVAIVERDHPHKIKSFFW